jgi:hypothetical protein
MIIDFKVTNFRSFKTSQDFSMVALRDSKKAITVKSLPGTKEKLLPIATILGANASGKSNFILSIKTLVSLITNPSSFTSISDFYHRNRYRFTEDLKPIEFEIRFLINNNIYFYGIAVSESGITQEYLYKDDVAFYNAKQDQVYPESAAIFQRENNIAEYNPNIIQRPNLTHNQPLLSQLNLPDIMDWFKNIVFDVEASIPTLKEYMQNQNFNMFVNIVLKRELSIEHKINEKVYTLSLEDESSGTLRMIAMLWKIYQAYLGKNTIFILDDLDNDFHDAFMKDVYLAFLSPFENKNSQFIFTSHSFYMLYSDLYGGSHFRSDNTWVCNKDHEDKSEIFPLSDFKNIDGNIYHNYLQGRYGGMPMNIESVKYALHELEYEKDRIAEKKAAEKKVKKPRRKRAK